LDEASPLAGRKFLVFRKLRAIGTFDSRLIPPRESTDLIGYQKPYILGTQFMDGGAECFAGERTLVGH
jgi:hypothetical protein